MALVRSYYRCKGKTKNKLTREAGYANRYRNCYRAVYPSASYSRRKGRVVYSIAVYKRRKLG
jgi:hypothetical protein